MPVNLDDCCPFCYGTGEDQIVGSATCLHCGGDGSCEAFITVQFTAFNKTLVGGLKKRECMEPEDVAQEAWLRTWVKLRDYRPRIAPFRTWVWIIAKRIWFHQVRDDINEAGRWGKFKQQPLADPFTVTLLKEIVSLMPPELVPHFIDSETVKKCCDGVNISTMKARVRRFKIGIQAL